MAYEAHLRFAAASLLACQLTPHFLIMTFIFAILGDVDIYERSSPPLKIYARMKAITPFREFHIDQPYGRDAPLWALLRYCFRTLYCSYATSEGA